MNKRLIAASNFELTFVRLYKLAINLDSI